MKRIIELINEVVKYQVELTEGFAKDHLGDQGSLDTFKNTFDEGLTEEYIRDNFGSIYCGTTEEILEEMIIESKFGQELKEEDSHKKLEEAVELVEGTVSESSGIIGELREYVDYGNEPKYDRLGDVIEKMLDAWAELPGLMTKLGDDNE